MKQTKEECLNAYDLFIGEVCGCSCTCCVYDSSSCKFRKAKDTLKQLINEHFELIKAIEFIFGVKSEDVLKEYERNASE